MWTIAVLFVIPVLACLAIRDKFYAFLAASPIGIGILWARMISNEVLAADSDLDIIFAVACLFWSGILVGEYALICSIAAFLTTQRRDRP